MEGSNTTLTGAPISFHHLYEAATPQHIPFNLGPNFNADVQKFLFIPTKRNAPFRTNRHDLAQGNVVNRALAALRGSPSAGNVNEAAAQDHAIFLDFERFLMPVINEALASDAHLGARWAPGDSGSLQRCDTVSEFGVSRRPVEDFRKTKALVPSQSQWAHLNSLRMHSGSPERSEVGIKKLTEYYAQLVFINHKFDLNAKKMHQSFGWYEAFSTERLVLSPCIHFEMAAVLYNIAAIYSQLACTQPLWSIHGKKLAADYFKKSAGIFIYLRDTHSQRIQVRLDKTSDLTETSLNAAAQIMSAQAMECYFDKANEDKKSSPVMSKISAQTADFFDLAVKFSKEGLNVLSKQRFPKIWLHQLTAKTYLYAAIAHLHAPLLLVAEQALGERVARLSVSKTLAHRALKSSKDAGGSVHEIVKAYVDSIQSSYSLAEAANFEKHHHPHIDVSLASSLARPAQTLVHPIPGSETLGDLSMFTDFFAAYKPLEIDADLSCLATYAVQVVEGATRELETSKTEIESLILANTGIQNEPLKSILNENKTRANAVSEMIEIIRRDELDFSCHDMLQKTELIQLAVSEMHHECTTILETSRPTGLDLPSKKLYDTLCKALHQEILLVEPHALDLKALKVLYLSESISNFHPVEWTQENLEAVLPCLDITRSLSIEDVVSEKKRELAVKDVLTSVHVLEKLKTDCLNKTGEISNFVESMEIIRNSSAIHSQKLRLKLIEESVAVIKKEKVLALKKISEVSSVVKNASPKRRVEEESRKTIVSFEKAISDYKKLRAGLTLQLSQFTKHRVDTETIYKACQSLKKGHDGDSFVTLELEALALVNTQFETLKAAQEAKSKIPSPKAPSNGASGLKKSEEDLLKSIKIQLDKMKTATPIVASNAPLNELDAVISLLREHVNHGPKVPLTATPAATQAAIDQNEAVLRLIKIILNEKDAPLNKEQNAPKFEDPAEKSAKERAKFKDELHTLAIAQQQEILRISRLKEEREREARIAEEVELNRRAEVKMLGQEAWKVLTGASMINCKTGEQGVERKASKGRLGPRYPSGFSLGAPRRGHSHGGELGINPFWPYGSGKIKRPSGARRVSSPPSENQDEAFFDTEEDLVETPTFASEADSDADKNALEALHNAANLVDACAKKHEIYAEKAAQFKKMEEEARKRESLLEKERHERRHEKEKRHGHLEPEHHGFLNDLLHMNFLSGNAANGGSGSGHTRAPLEHQRSMLDFLHWNRAQPNPVPENSENLRAYMEALAAARAREAAASAARPAPIRRQSRNTFGGGGPTVMQVNVPEVVLPSAALNEKSMAPSDKCGSTTPDSKCETKTVPVHHVSLFGALGGLAYKPIDMIDHIIHPSHYRLSESGAPVASPSRKPVNHDKPGMVSKAVQDLEESELLASMSLSPSKTKKSMKKRDSGVAGVSSSSEGSASEKKAQSAARKHGNLSRAKFENELILQHFENLNNYGNMPQ